MRNRVPPTTYGVVSKLPVSASRVSSVDVSALADHSPGVDPDPDIEPLPTRRVVLGEVGLDRIYTWHNTNLQHKDETNKK